MEQNRDSNVAMVSVTANQSYNRTPGGERVETPLLRPGKERSSKRYEEWTRKEEKLAL